MFNNLSNKFKVAASDRLVTIKAGLMIALVVLILMVSTKGIFGGFIVSQLVWLALLGLICAGLTLSLYEAFSRPGLKPLLSIGIYAVAGQLMAVPIFFGYAIFSRTALLTIAMLGFAGLCTELVKLGRRKTLSIN